MEIIRAKRKKREPSNKLPTGLVNMRRRAYDSVLSSVGTGDHEVLEEDELKFLQAAESGDLTSVRGMLEDDSDSTNRLLRVSDYKDRTAIEIAAENEHLDLVEYLVKHCSRTLDMHSVNESLMLAISRGYLRITQTLLNHPMYLKSKDKFRLGSLTNYFQPKNNSKFDHDLTPIMLAAHVNEIDIIRVLLRRGDFVKKPHHTLCECTPCNNKRKFDPLKHSLAGIHAYRALSSPAYISLTSPDPILTAFLLSKDLMELSVIEKEFKNEYRDLAKQCKNYASELLHMCQNSDEVRTILNQAATSLEGYKSSTEDGAEDVFESSVPSESAEEKNRNCSLARLKLAIRYRQKQFVAHPHIQHQLATMWYQNFPGWRQSGFFYKLLAVFLIPASLPVMAIIYWIAPNSQAGKMVSTPLVKFIVHTASYLIFLLLLFLESALMATIDNDDKKNEFMKNIGNRSDCREVFEDIHDGSGEQNFMLRFSSLTPLEYIIVIYIVGMWWQEIKQIYEEGYRRYLASTWNWLDITMLNLYVSCFILKILSYSKADAAITYFNSNHESCMNVIDKDETALQHHYYIDGDRRYWLKDDPTLVAEALFAMANVLSFSRMSYVLPVSEFLGPLQISLGRMLGDIFRFSVVFMVVFMAFFCALYNLYWDYPERDYSNCPQKQGFGFATFENTFLTLFWALFGLAAPADTTIPNSTEYGENGHTITENIGTMLFMIYHVVMALVMLNMLIAMMSNSFQEIESDEDVEWKFARSQLWLSYLEKGATLPIPFNLVPSPKSFLYLYNWIRKHITRWRRSQDIQGPPRNRSGDVHMTDRRNGVFNIMNHTELRRTGSTHEINDDTPGSTSNSRLTRTTNGVRSSSINAEGIMKGIVKRYLFKLQRDKENDEINEGELDEIKNDISSLRFELLEEFKKETTIASTAQLSPKKRKEKELSTVGENEPKEDVVPNKTACVSDNNPDFVQEVNTKIHRMDAKMDSLAKQMDRIKKDILEALVRQTNGQSSQSHNVGQNHDVEYI